jgi:hypothetical protein
MTYGINLPLRTIGVAFLLVLSPVVAVRASTLYVDLNCTNPVSPYVSSATAAKDIQSAVDAANSGDTVLVATGTYTNGSRSVYGGSGNRVAITKAITVQSINGSTSTVIQGAAFVRCAYVTNGATLVGFTLTGGNTLTSGTRATENSGGGAWCESSAVLSNCIISGNATFNAGNHPDYGGGGVYGGMLYNCTIASNSAYNGGGVYGSVLFGCSLIGNSAMNGGGSYGATLNNCIISQNTASYNASGNNGGGCNSCTANNCLIINNSASFSYGGGAYVTTLNNCTVYGNYAYKGGGTYGAAVFNSIVYNNTVWWGSGANYPNGSGSFAYSCAKSDSGGAPGGTGNTASDPKFVNASSDFHLQSGSPCIGAGSPAYVVGATDLDGNPRVINGLVDMGAYQTITLQVSNSGASGITPTTAVLSGVLTSSASQPATVIVYWGTSDGVTNPASWTTNANLGSLAEGSFSTTVTGITASTTYFYRCFATNASGMAWATNTISFAYSSSHFVWLGNSTPVTPYATWATAATNIQDAVNICASGDSVIVTDGVYAVGGLVAYGAMTNRVAITQAVTVRSVNGPAATIIQGAGPVGDGAVRCAYVTNGAALVGFTLSNGFTRTAGDLSQEQSGGGLWCVPGAVVSNCVLVGSTANVGGGGAYDGALFSCLIVSNTALYQGGGAYGSTLNNCTVFGNTAAQGGGVNNVTAQNCILSGNSATTGANWLSGTYDHCCTAPLPSGAGNFTSDPMFVGTGDFHLQVGSPCIDTGTNQAWMTGALDLDGLPRIAGASVDMGAYEATTAWLGFNNWAVGLGFSGPVATLFAQTNANGLANGFVYAFGTNWSAGQLVMTIKVVNGQVVVETPAQDALSYAALAIQCCTNLISPNWIAAAVATNNVGKPANRIWDLPPVATSNAFFRIQAVLN